MTSVIDQEIAVEEIPSEMEDEEAGFEHVEYEISVYPADFTLQGLYDKWLAGTIRMPPFQRRYVWPLARASELIESFMLAHISHMARKLAE